MVGGSVGLLLIVWSILAMKDRGPGVTAADASTTQATVAPANSANSSSSGSATTSKTNTRVQAAAAPTARPQTRSSGS
jgi:hypothetical protein